MTNTQAPFNTIFVLRASQQVITGVKKALQARHLNIADIHKSLSLIDDALLIAIDKINQLTKHQEEAQETFTQAEHQASDLMDDINKLVKDNKALTAIEAATIAKDLYKTAEDLYFLLGAGVTE